MSTGTTHQGDGGRSENPPDTFASVHSQIDRMFTELQRIETHFKKDLQEALSAVSLALPAGPAPCEEAGTISSSRGGSPRRRRRELTLISTVLADYFLTSSDCEPSLQTEAMLGRDGETGVSRRLKQSQTPGQSPSACQQRGAMSASRTATSSCLIAESGLAAPARRRG